MRIGLHCTETDVTVALLARDTVRAVCHTPVQGDDLPAAIDGVLAQLSQHETTLASHGAIVDLTAEVSDLLEVGDADPVHLIRISPRAPLDRHHRWIESQYPATTTLDPLHLAGGHNAQGDEIVPLDTSALSRLADSSSAEPRAVITSVGALINADHELRAGAALLQHMPHANVEYGHYFHHTSFAVRERTAVHNVQLRDRAEAIVSAISFAAAKHFPGVRLFVASNSGGSIPLSRLVVTPVHSMVSRRATEAIAAAIRAGVADGPLEFESRGATYTCEIAASLPSVVPILSSPHLGKLASPAANVQPGSVNHAAAIDPGSTSPPDEACAVSAAMLPRIEWNMSYIEVDNEPEMVRAKAAAEARVHARLVATGAPPESIHTAESVITATSYGNPRVIALRIRAFADPEHLLAKRHVGA